MEKGKKTLLSGIQPSGELHIGNYFGAMRQFVDLQDEYDTYISIVNYHALTTLQDKEKLAKNTLNAAIDHIAAGLDPQKMTLFIQSDVPQVTELAWIFDTLVTVPFLERGVAYKDKVSQGLTATAGLLTYPVLQAADILILNADIVPVGEDQKQHIEYTRDIAEKFNAIFGDTFKTPKAEIKESVGEIVGVDGRKMHKSYKNTIPLFATEDEVTKAVMSIPTDSKDVNESKNPEEDLVFQFHKLFSADELGQIKEGYEKGGLSYKESKEKLIKNINEFIEPLREKREKVAANEDEVRQILENGGEKVREKAELLMHEVREKTGLSF